MTDLFTPFPLKNVTLRNRIAVPPMCQYTAENGYVNNWHQVHYASLARGGSGLVIVEATAVSPEGRITPKCLGLWDDAHIEGLRAVAASIKAAGAVPGIQIGHAGRKASANIPWEGDDHIPAGDARGWQPLAPSAIAFGPGLDRVPLEMTLVDIARVQNDFVAAARRALEAGFEWLELHFAHGYLAQSFFSTYSNTRTDQYGGSAENRGRFLSETVSAVKAVWPENLPLAARFGVLEFDGRDEETLLESIALVKDWRSRGLDFLNVSIGFSTPKAHIPWGPAFMGSIAKRVGYETGLPVSTAWGFGEPHLANMAVAEEQMDVVMIGKAHLADPFWPYYAAKKLGKEKAAWLLPPSYAHWLEHYHSPDPNF